MNNDHSYDVVIIGAGPTGLTLANILGYQGLNVLVIECNSSTVQEPRAVSIDDEALRTMQSIGLVEAVMRDVAADYGSHYMTANGRCFAKVEPVTREYGFPRRNAFAQPRLEHALLEGAKRFANVTLLFRHTVVDLQQDSHEVKLRLRADDGREKTVRSLYVAGCDGARSLSRKQIGAKMVGSSYPQRWLIVDLASTKEQLRQTRVACDPKRPLITLPGPYGMRRYEFMLLDEEEEEMATQHEFVQRLLAAHGPDAASPIVRCQVYTFHALVADKWNMGRIFLAGDAAHLSPPFAGQGMNSGLRDAFNLGWKLGAVVRGEFTSQLLDTYFEEREPHARELIQLSINMGRVMMPKSRVQALLIQNAFRLTRFAPNVQAYFTQMKYKPKPSYRCGFLDAQDETKLAGRMLPQPVVEDINGKLAALDERLGNCFRLVAFGKDAQQCIQKTRQWLFGMEDLRPLAILPSIYNPDRTASPEIEAVRDVNRVLNSVTPTGRTVMMLVRPDRYIAAASFKEPFEVAEKTRLLFASYRRSHERS